MPIIRDLMAGQQRSGRRRMPWLGGSSTSSTVSVTPERSLQIGSVYACVRLLSETVSGLPVSMHDRRGDSRIPVDDDPVLTLIRDYPNPVIDAAELWRTVMGWMLLRGNGYVYVERNGAGRPVGLWPIAPTSIDVRRTSAGPLAYKVTLDSSEFAPIAEKDSIVGAANVLHFRAFGLGMEGLSPIGLARESVGISFAAQQYMGGFYARDASPGGVLATDGNLTDDQFDRLNSQWKSMHEGFDNSHRLAILEGGAKWMTTSLSPDDAQFIETQKFTRSEIAMIYGVPPHMIGDTEKTTSWGTGIAEMGIGFVTYALRTWTNRLERVTRRLITQPERRTRWNVDGLMQGDTKSRYDAYATARQWGWVSVNDIRKKEDMTPIDNGDDYLQPLNMVPAGSQPLQRSLPMYMQRAALTSDALKAWVTRHHDLLVRLFADQRDSVITASGVMPLDREEWDAKLASLLLDPSIDLVREVAAAMAAQLGGHYDPARALEYLMASAEMQARNINITTEDEIQRALVDAQQNDVKPVDAVGSVFDQFATVRAGLVASYIVDKLGSFGRHEGASQSGARFKVWSTGPNARSSHAAMDGQTIPIDQPFSNGAMWPRDPTAGVDEVAGCNCTASYLMEAL